MKFPLARGRSLDLHAPVVMGILNATPDSFSDGGALKSPQDARDVAKAMVAAGAGILDLGGESTRPGAAPVSAELELRRVMPALEAVRRALPQAVVSIDTSKAEVADAALQAGADFVNDVSGLADPAMADVVRRHACGIVLMRNQGLYGDVVESARAQMGLLLQKAQQAGIPAEAVMLDPGIGFGDPPGSSPADNLALIRNAGALGLGRPVLVGASRKRFIGRITGVQVPAQRVVGSVAAAILAVQSGAAVVRVHDVEATVEGLRVAMG